MISEIRLYFKNVVKQVNPDFKMHRSPIEFNNIPESVIDYTYFLNISSMSSALVDTDIRSVLPVSVRFTKKGGSNEVESYDCGYEQALDIQSLAMKKESIDQSGIIKGITSNGIEVAPILDNDNSYSYTIQFEVTLSYKWI